MSPVEFIPIVIAIVLLPAMLGLMVVGERIAKRTRPAQAAPIDGAILALLGLLLGFQFAGATTRLETRRQIVVKEANAIGTAYLRIDLLPADDQPQMRDLFRTYTTLRIRMVEADRLEHAHAADAESRKLQSQIWSKAIAACRKDPSPATQTLVISSLNDMFDVTTERIVASRTHTPLVIVALLFGVTLASAFLIGYSTIGLQHSWILRGLFATVIVGTLYVTLDMEFPRVGLIRVGAADDAMIDTRRGMD
ncbi:MAG: DUF4239 domain-containing protein [Planctomycetes bacterium]|nr:DUF4239 domain-containing protein [Planctomycetota bacterium]